MSLFKRRCKFDIVVAAAGQTGQDRLGRTAWAGQPGQDSLGRTAWAGQPGQDSLDRTGSTGQPWQDSPGKTAVAGELNRKELNTAFDIVRTIQVHTLLYMI
jgi:hypothetical protein